jgi:hypothetical protein
VVRQDLPAERHEPGHYANTHQAQDCQASDSQSLSRLWGCANPCECTARLVTNPSPLFYSRVGGISTLIPSAETGYPRCRNWLS